MSPPLLAVKRLKWLMSSVACVDNHTLQKYCLLFVVGVFDITVITCICSDKIQTVLNDSYSHTGGGGFF